LDEPAWFQSAVELVEPTDPSRSGPGPAIRKRPQGAKLKSRRAALAGSPNLHFLLRAAQDDFLFEVVNPAFETSTGLSNVAVAGRALQDVLPQAIAAQILSRCRHCMSGGPPATPILVMMPAPAGLTPWELSLTPRFDESGAVMGVSGTAREISEGAGPQAESPGDAEGRLPNIRFTALPNGRVEQIHPTLLTVAGLPLDFPIEAIVPLVRPEELARLSHPSDRGQADAVYENHVRLRGPGGRYRWFRVRAELVDGLAGRRWYGLAIDVEAEKSQALDGVKSSAPRIGLFAGFNDCSVTVDHAWRITSLTPAAAGCVGESQAQLIGADCRERLPIPKGLIEAFETDLGAQALQVTIPASDHSERWMEFQIHPFASGARIRFWDIAKPRGVHATPPVADWSLGMTSASTAEMALLDADGVIISVNGAWRQSVEQDPICGTAYGVGMSYLELCNAAIPDLDSGALAEGMNEVVLGHRAGYAQPYVIAKSSGLWWRQLRIIPFRLEPSLQLIAIHEDITDVSQARAALRNTSEQMLSALAHERERIAFELHDSTSQHLAALGLGLMRLKHIVGDSAEDLIADMTKSVRETVREIRVLSYLMKPLGLGRGGLRPAARQFVSGFGARTGLQVEVRIKGSFRAIPDTVQGAAYRILQEALSNVYKHADASHVGVDLINCGGALHVRVADDGRGISLSSNGQLAVAPGVGLASMESRVVQLGGTFVIARGALGTIVEASIPLSDPRG
jgi:signal transduction histidine kinase